MKELFEEQLRDQLYNHEVAPPSHSWDEIQKRIQPTSVVSSGLKNWAKWSAVAVLLLGSGSAIYLVNDYLSKPEIAISNATGLQSDSNVADESVDTMAEEKLVVGVVEAAEVVVPSAESTVSKEASSKESDKEAAKTKVDINADAKLRYSDIQLSDIKVKTITNTSNHQVLLSCTNLKGVYDKVVWKISSLNIESEGFEITENIQNGSFSIELVAYQNGKIANTIQTKINVGGAPYLGDVSYVISPNNDGIKDLYIVDANNVEKGVLTISKDGETVFVKNELPLIWNGKDLNGNVVEAGFYDVNIQLESPDGKKLNTDKKVKVVF